jgi:hypothetical protein
MFDYDQARGYLHSRHLRWSYAAMKGREPAAWQALVASMPPREMAETLAFAGFRGIWVDRQSYPDTAAALAFEAKLGRVLGVTPIVSGNERLSFFSMVDYWRRIRKGLAQDEIARWRNVARHPVLVEWGRGFVRPQGLPESASRWGKPTAQLVLRNDSQHPQRATLHLAVSGASAGTLRVTGP